MASPRVAFVTTTDPRVAVEDTDRAFHDAAFAALGLALEHRGWDEAGVDWAAFDLVVIRSPWDYPERLGAFLAWLDALAPLATLHNPAAVVRWNLDKGYLGELADAGLPVVPTAYASTEAEAATAIAEVALPSSTRTDEVVVKPTVSAGSRDTGRFARTDPAALALAERIVASGRTAMVQPAIPSVAIDGEVAFVVVDGEVSHAYRKGPLLAAGGGLLSGDEYREVREPVVPDPAWSALAVAAHDAAVQAAGVAGPLLYARIDLVALPSGEPALLEAELFEPFLSMDLDAAAPARFARACRARITSRS